VAPPAWALYASRIRTGELPADDYCRQLRKQIHLDKKNPAIDRIINWNKHCTTENTGDEVSQPKFPDGTN
jgi:hypothetical protein